MTIVTKPLTAFKEKKEEADAAALVNVENNSEENVSQPDLHLPRVQRLRKTNHVCLVLSLAVVSLMGLMVGLHVYRSVFMKRVYCNTYRIPLNHGVMPENTLVAANFQNPRVAEDPFKMDMFALFNHEIPDTLQEEQTIKDFEFDVELDMEDNVMETLELPEIFLGRYMHDFKINQTVIVDTLAKRCFLMKLDRNLIPAPRSIYEILAKMRNGAFDIDYEEIRKSYRINGPPIQAFDRSHGAFIPDVCSSKITYNLEEIDRSYLVKREVAVGSSGNKFGEFVGSSLITYDIVNINQL